MKEATKTEKIDLQIADYVSRLSIEKKKEVLSLLEKFNIEDDIQYRSEFEKRWTEGISLEEARQHTLKTVRKLFNEKNSSKQ